MLSVSSLPFPKAVGCSALYRVKPALDLGECVIPEDTTITLIHGKKFYVVLVPMSTRCARTGSVIQSQLFRFPKEAQA